MEIKVRLPDELVERALRVGLKLDVQEQFIAFVEAKVRALESAANPSESLVSRSVKEQAWLAPQAQTELDRLTRYCQTELPIADFRLSEAYGYASLPLCIIDAIYSINSTYEATENVVIRFCAHMGIPRLTTDHAETSFEFTVVDLLRLYQTYSAQELADNIYKNRQRTSTQNGILKAEAVRKVAEVLRDFNVNVLADVEKIAGQSDFEYAYKQIPGQGSGVSLRYFYMLTGSDEHIKPDRMIIRFISEVLGRPVQMEECHPLLVEVCRALVTDFPELTPRMLDNIIWQFQRGR